MSKIDLYKWKKSVTSVNCNFLARYHITTAEALKSIIENPEEFSEFSDKESILDVDKYIDFYLVQHNYASLLLAYATFEETIVNATEDLRKLTDTEKELDSIKADDSIEKYKKFIGRHCGIDHQQLPINWGFFKSFAVIRNFIIHANGNLSQAKNKDRVKSAIANTNNRTKLESSNKLIIESSYIYQCLTETKKLSYLINDYIITKICST